MNHIEPDNDVEQLLRSDPCGAYAQTDNNTRLRCHGVIAEWHLRTGIGRVEIAERALERARRASRSTTSFSAAAHVGYYLIGNGAQQFAAQLGVRLTARQRLRLYPQRYAPRLYQGGVSSLASVLLCAVALLVLRAGIGLRTSIVITLLGLPLVVQYVAAFVRALLLATTSEQPLPKLMGHSALLDSCVTLLVVPTIVSTPQRARDLLGQLAEVAAANADPSLRFALLSDFDDAATQSSAQDGAILDVLRETTDRLNSRAHDAIGDRFFVLHRTRSWSATQQSWIGWERKRGKILELTRHLQGVVHGTPFGWIFGDLAPLLARVHVSYVLSFDEGTAIPRGLPRELVRTAAHPLNRPSIGEQPTGAASGFAILQPTFMFVPPTTSRAQLEATTALSSATHSREFYADVLGAAVHKGAVALYDTSTYRRLLDGTFPEESVLQHDLLDGFVARTAVIADVFVFQAQVANHLVQWRRGHRWLRGALQAVPWMLPRVRNASGVLQPNPLRAIGRFYIGELVLKELAIPASLVLLIWVWLLAPSDLTLWTIALYPPLARLIWDVARELFSYCASGVMPSRRRAKAGRASRRGYLLPKASAALFSLAVLAHEAVLVLDALARVTWRMGWSRKHLLDWTTRRSLERDVSCIWQSYLRTLWPSSAIGLVTLVVAILIRPSALWIAGPIAAAWICAPWLVWQIDTLDSIEGTR